MTWQALSISLGTDGLTDSARHVIGYHLIIKTRIQMRVCDVASTVHQSLHDGVVLRDA